MPRDLIFVIGSPRSGSTLLSRMLGAHSQIHAPAEPHLLTPLAHLGYYARVDDAPYDTIVSAAGINELVAALPNGEQDYQSALRAYSDRLYDGLLEGTGCAQLLDKTPAYALVLEFLEKLYPDARYIVLTRHPIAVWTSQVESFFDGDFEAAQERSPLLERYVPAIARFLRETKVENEHVQYEALVQDPRAHMERLASFLGLEFEEAMVEYGSAGKTESARGLGDPTSVSREQRPTTTSLARWAKDLAGKPAAVAYAERLVDGLLDEDLASWGFERREIQKELAAVDQGAKVVRSRPLTRYALERRLLLRLRRNIHHNAFGRLVKRLRWACDVLLR
jgi:hypothetical protein